MRIWILVREALVSAWATKVSSVVVAVVSAIMCFAALATVGQSAANQASVQASIASRGARVLIVRDTANLGFINTRTLTEVRALSTVDAAIGLGLTVDSTNGRIGPGGTLVTTWPMYGDLSDAIELVKGRWPQPGEAVVSMTGQEKFGLAEPVGYLAVGDDQYPIVGRYSAKDGFDDLATGAVVNANLQDSAIELRVVIGTISAASVTQSAVLSILAPGDTAGLSVQSPLGVAELTQMVNAQLASFGRSLMLLILGVGGLFVAAVVLADVLVRRHDLGRRRTLGITRTDLTALVMLRAAIPALLGAILGSAIATIITTRLGYRPPYDFCAAVALLATLTAIIAAIPPAVYAARLDPVRVMRTP